MSGKKHHFTNACKTRKWKQKKDDKQAKVNAVNTVDTAAADTSAVSAVLTPAAAVAALNFVKQVAPRSAYTFDPDRYSEASNINVDFWKMTSIIPIQTERLWKQDRMEVASVEGTSFFFKVFFFLIKIHYKYRSLQLSTI